VPGAAPIYCPPERNIVTGSRLNFYVCRICLVATLGGLLFGYDTAVISGANDALKVHFHLSDFYLGWVVGSALLGCCAGVLVAGKLTDLIGRRAVLALSAVLFLVSALICAITVTPTELVCARILGGIGVGMASLLSPLYIAELSPSRIRGALVSLNQIAILVGMVLSYFVNAWIAKWGMEYYTHPGDQFIAHYAGQPDPPADPAQFWLQTMGWRYMLGAMAIPAAIFLLLTFGIPESPRWLLKRERIDDARGVLKRINGDDAVVEAEMTEIRTAIAHEQGKLAELFRPGTRGTVFMAMVLALFQAITGINIVMYYAPTIFTSAGMGAVAALSTTVIIPVVMIAFTIGSMFLVDRVGRKPIMLLASAGMGISLALLGYTFAHQAGAHADAGLLECILTYVASFSIGMGGIYWVVVTEIFPTRVRGAASSLSVVFLWGGNFLVSLYFPVMLAQMKGDAFFVFAAMCALCFVFILLCVPETKGKSLEQIEHELFKV
jgi:SP family arabinose:H+ symporter-like MFS transporter